MTTFSISASDIMNSSIQPNIIPILRKNAPVKSMIKETLLRTTIAKEKQNIQMVEDLIMYVKERHPDAPEKLHSLKISLKVSKAKAGLLSHIYNGNAVKAQIKQDRVNQVHLLLMELQEETEDAFLAVVETEVSPKPLCGVTKHGYMGHKQEENYRQLGESIRKFNIFSSNCKAILC